jgi:hypothetical protein
MGITPHVCFGRYRFIAVINSWFSRFLQVSLHFPFLISTHYAMRWSQGQISNDRSETSSQFDNKIRPLRSPLNFGFCHRWSRFDASIFRVLSIDGDCSFCQTERIEHELMMLKGSTFHGCWLFNAALLDWTRTCWYEAQKRRTRIHRKSSNRTILLSLWISRGET